MKILSFGEIIWDIYPDNKCIGGAPLNFAAHVAKRGVTSYLASAVGSDILGKDALLQLEKFAVKTDYVSTLSGKSTGTCTVLLDENGVPSYNLATDTAYDYISFPSELYGELFDAISFGTLALRSENNRRTLKSILDVADTVYCDLNLRYPFYTDDTVRFALESANILKISDTELDFLRENILKTAETDYSYLLNVLCDAYANIGIVLLTCGEKGAYLYTSNDRKILYRMAKKVNVVSTVGAGDSFGAVFLADYLLGKSLDKCLDGAICASAQVVSHKEAVPLDF